MSQLTVKEKEIEGQLYSISMLHPDAGLDLAIKTIKVVGPSLSQATQLASKDKNEMVGSIIKTFCADLTISYVQDAVKLLKDQTEVDGVPLKGIYAMHFRGRLGLLMKWFVWGMEAQIGDFLGDIPSLLSESIPGE